jgi:hypothetical protein
MIDQRGSLSFDCHSKCCNNNRIMALLNYFRQQGSDMKATDTTAE